MVAAEGTTESFRFGSAFTGLTAQRFWDRFTVAWRSANRIEPICGAGKPQNKTSINTINQKNSNKKRENNRKESTFDVRGSTRARKPRTRNRSRRRRRNSECHCSKLQSLIQETKNKKELKIFRFSSVFSVNENEGIEWLNNRQRKCLAPGSLNLDAIPNTFNVLTWRIFVGWSLI